jgi:LuxR family transcriptional regulator, maltose regulon positive regulatory protein
VFAVARFGTAASPAASACTAGLVPRRSLFEQLGRGARVAEVTAPAGSGKTSLLRTWIRELGLTGSAAWVPVQPEERDSRRFWISVLDALRATAAGSNLVMRSTPAPDLDGWAIVERLLEDLAPLEDRIWLVIDDLHELHSGDAFRQLELLVMHAPDELRFVVSSRQQLGLGLHRLRLEDEPTGTRAVHLRFTFDEVRGTHALTEGLGLLAGTKLSGHPKPERLSEPLTKSEIRVLRFLPTNLTQPEIAEELSLSVNTINTHIRHLYTKLAAHRRGEAVERARGLGLLAPSLGRR